jgi:hypothetical protein
MNPTTAIYKIVPMLRLIAWETFKVKKDSHFFLYDIHEMDLGLPNLKNFAAWFHLAHRKMGLPHHDI